MPQENLTIEYAEEKIKELRKDINSPDTLYKEVECDPKFFIEFIEIMNKNGISDSGCNFFASILKEYLINTNSIMILERLVAFSEIYLEIIKPAPSVYEKRGILNI